jgi:hypothetical protein
MAYMRPRKGPVAASSRCVTVPSARLPRLCRISDNPAVRPDLSIVVASCESARRIEAALASLVQTAAAVPSEILVIDASADILALQAAQRRGLEVVRLPHGTLVPMLWAEGIRRARGRFVAITTGHTVVGPAWAPTLVRSFDDPAVGGVGGPLRLAPAASALDAAVFFLRYSAFLTTHLPEGRTEGEIAGDNAAYLLDDLRRDQATLRDGFWEVAFHRQLRERGKHLVGRRDAWAEFGHAFPFGVIARHRFRHGREFAAARLAAGSRSRAGLLLAAPLVPALLAARAVTRVRADAEHRGRLLTALPALLALAAAWAAGEAVGAVRPPLPHIPPAHA